MAGRSFSDSSPTSVPIEESIPAQLLRRARHFVKTGVHEAADTISRIISSGGGDPTLCAEQKAILDACASREGATYNTFAGGGHFSDFSNHPGVKCFQHKTGPHAGQWSSGAGRYQFEQSTWRHLQEAYGLPNFSPASQDKAAWYDAAEHYHNYTHRDLLSDLKAKHPGTLQSLASSLRGEWAAPGNPAFFSAVYQHSLEHHLGGAHANGAQVEGAVPAGTEKHHHHKQHHYKGEPHPGLGHIPIEHPHPHRQHVK